MPHSPAAIERHTIAVIVYNEPGVLARVIGLFSGRGYNIESLTVAETDAAKHQSRITVVTTGTPMVIEQIKAQLPWLSAHGTKQAGAAIEDYKKAFMSSTHTAGASAE